MGKNKNLSYNDIPNLQEDWMLDPRNGKKYSGEAVQKFIKKQLGTKMGYFYYDTSSNRYLIFADETSKDQYLENSSLTDLVLGSFDAPFNYEAKITLTSDAYVSVPIGTTGNTIEFTFSTLNKNGDEVFEDVVCTYTIVRGSVKNKVVQRYRAGQHVSFNLDDYLVEGTNRITIGIVGQTTLAATTVGVTYNVASLTLTDDFDIAKVYNISAGEQVIEIPFTLSGTGSKTVEWYLNGVQLPFEKNVDEVVDSSSSRIKYITLSNTSRGANYIEFRAYTLIEGEKLYSNTIHRDIIVENYELQDNTPIIALAYEKKNLEDDGIDIQQYIAYDLRFAVHNPKNLISTPTEIYIGESLMTTINVENGIENSYSILMSESGVKSIRLVAENTEYDINANVSKTNINVREISESLELDFSAVGRNNSMSGKNAWFGNGYSGTLSGFSFTQTSGWVNNKLLMSSGSKIEFDYAPLASESTSTGKTLEFEFASSAVSNDNTVLCDLRNSSGTGVLITASEASITSRGGTKLSVKYKPEENTRISFVINRATGVTNKGLVFVYVDGVISGAANFSSSDDFKSDKMLLFKGSENSEVILKQIRTYNIALSSDQILNNFTLYRDTTVEMLDVYNRNNVYEEDSLDFSINALQGQLPVMIVTGDIPTLENTTNKDTQITVDIEYYNLQDNERSFVMKNAAMRPQGTSSMLYPKKNFRIYTQKLENTEVYDGNGNLIENKLYAFKKGSQPVNCWCLKADYAESSGTHNTGIAKLWHEVLYNSTINGEHVFRTEAQKKALENGYPYDVRTTIDGFPILMFYRRTENDSLIFIGKYNFNNDKSTESVFGFTGIPGFNDSRMQCWEILNNGDALALFTNVSDFDSRWADAFESRYPDTKTPNISDLKAFSVWLNGINGNPSAFASEKWEHMNIYLMAAYYVYLMRFGAVDQTVKNAMLTSEDGVHFYFINYDNDTINGLRNNGILVFDPTIDRQSLDPETGGLAYAYAGHDSVLWNMLEADEEFMQIVKEVDNALYTNGLSYDRVIQVFNEQQADKWNERIYNQDAQYKYISPYTDSSLNNLEMLQGKRQSHRKWWLSRRFSLYDSKFVSGDFKGKALEFKVINNTAPGWTFKIEAGSDMEYGYGVYNPIETGVALNKGETHDFTVTQTLNIGDPVRIYSAVNLQGVDLSNILPRLSNVELNNVYNDAMGTRLKKLVLGNGVDENTILSSISSIAKAKRLEYLDVRGCKGIITLNLSSNPYLKTLKATGSGITGLEFAKGAPITQLELPSSMQTLRIEQLVSLKPSGLVLENNGSNVRSFEIIGCPYLSEDINVALSWLDNKEIQDNDCNLYIDNVKWTNVVPEDFLKLCTAKNNGMNITLKGKVKLTTSSQEIIDAITVAFGSTVFRPNNELYINAPDAIYLAGPSEILEGESAQFTAAVFTENYGTVTYYIASGSRAGVEINSETGYLTSIENGNSDSSFNIRAMHRPTSGSTVYVDKPFKVKQRTYPSNATISGRARLVEDYETYLWNTTTTGINGDYYVEWALSGDITSYAEIFTQTTDKCVIHKLSESTETIEGILTMNIKRSVDNRTVLSVTKTLSVLNPDIVMTSNTNPEVLAILYANGLAANENFLTIQEAESITYADMNPTDKYNGSIFYNSEIITFDELEYFIQLNEGPKDLLYKCTKLTRFKIPSTAVSCTIRLSYCKSLKEVIFEDFITSLDLMGEYFYPDKVVLPSNLNYLYLHLQDYECEEFHIASAAETLEVKRIFFSAKKVIIGENVVFNNATISLKNIEELVFEGQIKDVGSSRTYLNNFLTGSSKTLKRVIFEKPLETDNLIGVNDMSPLPNLEEFIFADGETKYENKNFVIYKEGALYAVLTPYSGALETLFTGKENSADVDKWYKYYPNYISAVLPSIFDKSDTKSFIESFYNFPNLEYFDCTNPEFSVLENGLVILTESSNTTCYGCAPKDRRMPESLVLPDNITKLSSYAFKSCKVIKNITIQYPVKIYSGIFENSTIENITVTTDLMGSSLECSKMENLKKIDLSQATGVSLDDWFCSYSTLEELLLPQYITALPKHFCRVSPIKKIPILSKHITTISGFSECLQLEEVEIPEGVTEITNNAFSSSLNIKTIFLPSTLTSLKCTFIRSKLERINIPDKVNSMSGYMFQYCEQLAEVKLPSSLTELKSYTFQQCTSLTEIIIPPLVTTIGDGCFALCRALKKITSQSTTAPSVTSSTFGSGKSGYTGRNTYNTGENMLYVPQGATGYDTSYWSSTLCNPDKCGFTLSATL